MWQRVSLGDQRAMMALADRAVPGWVDRGLRLVTHAGGATASIAFCLLLLLIPATRHLGAVAGSANLVSHLLVQALKRTVVRQRPTVSLPHLAALIPFPDHFSFPSGHACASMAVAVAVLLDTPLAGAPLLLIAFSVGASRFYLRVHYLTDVIVGQALGAVTAVLLSQSLA
ncbi:MAG: phosphatase PAP2 family protein [Gemmatimonadales bacterium]